VLRNLSEFSHLLGRRLRYEYDSQSYITNARQRHVPLLLGGFRDPVRAAGICRLWKRIPSVSDDECSGTTSGSYRGGTECTVHPWQLKVPSWALIGGKVLVSSKVTQRRPGVYRAWPVRAVHPLLAEVPLCLLIGGVVPDRTEVALQRNGGCTARTGHALYDPFCPPSVLAHYCTIFIRLGVMSFVWVGRRDLSEPTLLNWLQ
jgi:hypothetical protein